MAGRPATARTSAIATLERSVRHTYRCSYGQEQTGYRVGAELDDPWLVQVVGGASVQLRDARRDDAVVHDTGEVVLIGEDLAQTSIDRLGRSKYLKPYSVQGYRVGDFRTTVGP